jgi:hypothetical protein
MVFLFGKIYLRIVFFYFQFLPKGFLEYGSSIRCLTCGGAGAVCSLPVTFADNDESNENDIDNFAYDSDYVCQVNLTRKNRKIFVFSFD